MTHRSGATRPAEARPAREVADVVVIGGGVIGTSIAYQLASRGVRRVVVLERRFLAAGATGRSVGIVRQLYPTDAATRMVVRSLAAFRRFGDETGGDAGYVACGVLIGVPAALSAALAATAERQRGLGVRSHLLSAADIAAIEPRIDARDLATAVWEPDSGYGDPAAVTAGYAAAARRFGARIEQGAEVVALARDRSGVAAVETARGDRIATRVVVVAAGLWASAVARLAGVALPIVVGRHPVVVVERPPSFGAEHPVYLDLGGGAYARPERGGLTLTGSLTDDETKHPMDPERLGDEVGLDECAPILERTGRALPSLADGRLCGGWGGAFDITPDWMPILDAADVPGLWIAAGMSGHGFKLAPAIGEMMAALVTGAAPPLDTQPFRLARFAATPPETTFVASYLR